MTIGFTGPYSDVNFGDYAMLVNNLYALDDRDCVVFAYDRDFLMNVRDTYLQNFDISFVEVQGLDDFVARHVDLRYLTPPEILRAVTNLDEIRAAVSKLDVLYVNGGGYFNSLWAKPHRIGRLLGIMVPMLVAAAQNKRIVFTANGFGPFRGDTEFFASFFRSMPRAEFGIRENLMSPYWLTHLGIRDSAVKELPDDLLFIDSRLQGSSERPFAWPYVVVETYLPVEELQRQSDKFADFCTRLWDDYALRVVFVPFNIGHGGADQGRYLEAHFPQVHTWSIDAQGFLRIEDAVSIIRHAEFVVANRYHAIVLALAFRVPFASVLKDVLGDKQYYYSKNAGVLDSVLRGAEYDLTDFFFTDYFEALAAVAHGVHSLRRRQLDAFRSSDKARVEELRARRMSLFERPTE